MTTEKDELWLSNYKSKKTVKTNKRVTTREILKMSQQQTEELRVFLKNIAKIRNVEREPYSEPLKTEH